MEQGSVILLVDDQPENLLNLARYLEAGPQDFQLLTARSGPSALEVAHITKPDIIITDWDMPEWTGLELLKRIKQDAYLKDTPVIMITGVYTESEDLKQAMDFGAMDYLRKPINKIELWARVKSALTIQHAIHTIQSQNQEIRDQHQQLRQQKDRELSIKVMEAQQKNEALLEINTELKKIANTATGVVAMSLKRVIKQIEQNTRDTSQWEEFKQYFEKSHPKFLQTIEKQFPQLSAQDLRLCSYMKIHMTTHEIADLRHVTPETIRTQKYRIKKKLGLSKEVDLTEYLNSSV
ncbi:response regulator [Roseivirga sp. BDSF3-8]|uniref:response regulator n=1 Tax=Roseivirga sp. BDSF3-8 TaxID=3241598 RepID=UPI00353190F2